MMSVTVKYNAIVSTDILAILCVKFTIFVKRLA